MTLVQDHKCLAYFGGKDGKGTCDTACQWFSDGHDCPWWFTEEQWAYYEAHKNVIKNCDIEKQKVK